MLRFFKGNSNSFDSHNLGFWEETPLSCLYYNLQLVVKITSKWQKVLRLPNGSPKNVKLGVSPLCELIAFAY
jgi:hypothetical protein